jgi:LPPG:FO 2-phospho-L-lactate transferase
MAAGYAALLPPQDLLVAVNVGDDFVHFGLAISPDLDSVM